MSATTYHILAIDGTRTTHVVDWPREPGYHRIKELIEPILGDVHMEHVTVLHNGKRADMFVDEQFLAKELPFNAAASAIYRAATLARAPKTNPDSLPPILGPAILFDRVVWF